MKSSQILLINSPISRIAADKAYCKEIYELIKSFASRVKKSIYEGLKSDAAELFSMAEDALSQYNKIAFAHLSDWYKKLLFKQNNVETIQKVFPYPRSIFTEDSYLCSQTSSVLNAVLNCLQTEDKVVKEGKYYALPMTCLESHLLSEGDLKNAYRKAEDAINQKPLTACELLINHGLLSRLVTGPRILGTKQEGSLRNASPVLRY